MPCPNEPLPAGWRVWRGSVPAELSKFAIGVRDHVSRYDYGAIAEQTTYQGSVVGAFKSHHTWTYRNGQLLTGLCIPGVMLVVPTDSPLGRPAQPAASGGDLLSPDPDIPMWLSDADAASAMVLGGSLLGVAALLLLARSLIAKNR